MFFSIITFIIISCKLNEVNVGSYIMNNYISNLLRD